MFKLRQLKEIQSLADATGLGPSIGCLTGEERNIWYEVRKYLLITEFEVRTVSYGPSFFPLIYGPSAKRAGHESTGKNEDP